MRARALTNSAKIGVCLEDSVPYGAGNQQPKYNCENQGISKGFADIYTKDLDLQFIDATDVPTNAQRSDLQYFLVMNVNSNRAIREMDYSNNVAIVSVTI